jgi:hypothetical protein
MQEFVDETAEKAWTPINRKTMMATQGFINQRTYMEGNEITQINSDGYVMKTILNPDGSITEKFIGEKTITKTTTFKSDGSIVEALS